MNSKQGTKVSFILVPGLPEKIRQLALDMSIITPDDNDSLEQILELILPDLVDNALAGDRPAPSPDLLSEQQEDPDREEVNIAAAVAAAAAQVEDINIAEPELEIREVPPPITEEAPRLSFSDVETHLHGKVIQWAKGNPSKERAVCDTLEHLAIDLWGWERVLQLSERTYNMKYHKPGDPI